MGWAPLAAREGDAVCFFEGCEIPFVVRDCKNRWRLLGDCYVHGLVDGGVGGRDWEEMVLV